VHVPSHKSGLRSRLPRAVYAPLSAHTLRRQYCIGLNEYVDRAETGIKTIAPLGLHGQSPIKTRGCGMSATPLAIIEYGSVSATRLTGRS